MRMSAATASSNEDPFGITQNHASPREDLCLPQLLLLYKCTEQFVARALPEKAAHFQSERTTHILRR
jgi:hypothetical protein